MEKHRSKPKAIKIEFFPLHITPFQVEGTWFARAEEFRLTGQGESEADAERVVFHMVMRGVAFAASRGNLNKVLKKAGVQIKLGFLESEPTRTGATSVWSVPIPKAA